MFSNYKSYYHNILSIYREKNGTFGITEKTDI